jgi:hypothetical protein
MGLLQTSGTMTDEGFWRNYDWQGKTEVPGK